VSSSNVDPRQLSFTPTGRKPTVTPRSLTKQEIQVTITGLRASCTKRDGSRLRWCPDPRQLSLSDLCANAPPSCIGLILTPTRCASTSPMNRLDDVEEKARAIF